jgi:tRNA(fMet)-specific endonuclease VapC
VKYVLDTNAVSALMRADRAAIKRLKSVGRADVAVPQPVVAEIAYGLARLPKSKKRTALEARWTFFAAELPRAAWTEEVSARFGELKATLEKRGRRIADFDAAIAAHALARGATLVTADARHMERIDGLAVEDWSKAQAPG